MSKVELLQSPVTEVGEYPIKGHIDFYKDLSIELTDSHGVDYHPTAIVGKNVIVTIPVGNISVSSTYYNPDISYDASNMVDGNITTTQWLSVGGDGGMASPVGEYVDISLAGIYLDNTSKLVATITTLNNRNNKTVEVRAMTEDGYEVIDTFVTVTGKSHIIDVSVVDVSRHKSIRLVSITATGQYFGFADLHFTHVDQYNGYTIYDKTTAMRLSGSTLQVYRLDGFISSIEGVLSIPHHYNLYRKGADGTPTLIMAEPSKIGSSLNTTNLSTDLASLASKQYVTDTIDNLSRSSLAGKVDTYEDLPKWSTAIPYSAPIITKNGVPGVDEYAVSSNAIHEAQPNMYPPYMASYTASVSDCWHLYSLAGISGSYYYMTFKTPVCMTSAYFKNRSYYSQPGYVFAIKEYAIEAKGTNGWVELYTGTNDLVDYDDEWTVAIPNTGLFTEYRLRVDSSYAGANAAVNQAAVIDIIRLSGNQYVITDDARIGTMYLVGTEGNLEEYIFTEDLRWERMGEIRQSDVDLSDYTPTEGMMEMLNTASSELGTNIEAMSTEIATTLGDLNTDISGQMDDMPLDTVFTDSVSDQWGVDMASSGVLFVIEPDTIQYAAPELRTGNGTPFVDEYAVSIVGTNYGREPYLATYDSTGKYDDSTMNLNDSLYMTFKDPIQPSNIAIGNRYYASEGTYGYHITDFKVEAKTDSGDWITVIAATNPSSGWGVISKIPIQCDGFYREFRFTPLDCIPGAGGKIPYFNLVRLSGLIKKS